MFRGCLFVPPTFWKGQPGFHYRQLCRAKTTLCVKKNRDKPKVAKVVQNDPAAPTSTLIYRAQQAVTGAGFVPFALGERRARAFSSVQPLPATLLLTHQAIFHFRMPPRLTHMVFRNGGVGVLTGSIEYPAGIQQPVGISGCNCLRKFVFDWVTR